MALNTVSLRNSLSVYLQTFANRREVSTENLNFHNQMVMKVDGAVEAVSKQEQEILGTRSLSDEGKSTALATMATSAAAKFSFLERVVARHEEERREMQATLFTVKPPAHLGSDPLLQFLYGQEIRERFHGVTQQDKDVAFLKASEVDLVDPDDAQAQRHRDEILWAFQQTPGGPRLTPEIMQRALDERARHMKPATYAHLRDVTLLHESLNSLLDSVRGWLKSLGGDPVTIFKQLGGVEPTTPQLPPRMVAA